MAEPEIGQALVLDASVVINLLGTGAPEAVLCALPGPALIERRTLAEVLTDPSGRLPPVEARQELVDQGLLDVRELAGDSLERFFDLVTGPDALDDGEAATIVLALDECAVAVLDERKARRIVRASFGELRLDCTAGLMRALVGQDRLPAVRVREFLLAALQNARMSIPGEEVDWAVELLGPEAASQCVSIRRSAIIRSLWR